HQAERRVVRPSQPKSLENGAAGEPGRARKVVKGECNDRLLQVDGQRPPEERTRGRALTEALDPRPYRWGRHNRHGSGTPRKSAATAFAALILTVQAAPETESHPVHPLNTDSMAGVAVSV